MNSALEVGKLYCYCFSICENENEKNIKEYKIYAKKWWNNIIFYSSLKNFSRLQVFDFMLI